MFSEKRKSFQLELEEALSPPPLSLSAPELSARCAMPFRALRHAVSSTELLHERAMARFYQAVALENQASQARASAPPPRHDTHIPYNTSHTDTADDYTSHTDTKPDHFKLPEIVIKRDSMDSDQITKQMSLDSEVSDGRWQQASFDEDYTASTVSSNGYSDEEDEGSLDGDAGRGECLDDEETYNPRDKMARPSPVKEAVEEEEESEREVLKPLPLPDPNFVPKPILKRRESGSSGSDTRQDTKLDNGTAKHDEMLKPEPKQEKPEKPKKEEKMTIFKKITKMPVQKSFPFPKLLHKNKEADKAPEDSPPKDSQNTPKKVDNVKDRVSEEGRTVIDYYGNIVKEYGSQKKTAPPLYLNTEDLKNVAEKQQLEVKEKIPNEKKIVKTKKATNKTTDNKVVPNKTNSKLKPNAKNPRAREQASVDKGKTQSSADKVKKQASVEKAKAVKGKAIANASNEIENKKASQQVVLKTTERATIVIPIDYQQLEEAAKENVRSAIDYAVDVCLLALAFWVYLFKDERLAIPFLVLIIYRQLHDTLLALLDAPDWIQRHTPSWLKKKTS